MNDIEKREKEIETGEERDLKRKGYEIEKRFNILREKRS